MRLSNGLELNFNKETECVEFTKLIGNKLWKLSTKCGSCKMLFVVSNGYSLYSDDEFMKEAEAVTKL